MRLIDADELNELMYHEAFETDSKMQKWDSGCWIRYKMFENNIAKCKPVEVELVKHGHWKNYGFLDQYCSVCGNTPECEQGDTPPAYDYCPYCGAKMDEVR